MGPRNHHYYMLQCGLADTMTDYELKKAGVSTKDIPKVILEAQEALRDAFVKRFKLKFLKGNHAEKTI